MGGNGRGNNIGGNQFQFLDPTNIGDFDTIQRKLRLGTELSPDEMLAAEKFPVLKQLLDRLKEMNRQKELDKMREQGNNGFNNGGINNGFNNGGINNGFNNGGINNGFNNGANNNGFNHGGNNNGFNNGGNNNGFNNGANNNGFNNGGNGNINNGFNNNHNGGFPNVNGKDNGNTGFKDEDTDGDKTKVPVNSKWSKLKKRKFFFQAKPVRPENEIVEEPDVVYYLN
ncbi:uncharacterized protein DDB_G0287625-like [Ostrinia nubilalis]|uniref:uncharacterized protein DDB_G0287625-like n=1 Tax=Ostrinia nubilalis TaxID=29057 RepID=UPI0030822426